MVDGAEDLEDEVFALREDRTEDRQLLLPLFARLLDPQRCAEHAPEPRDDGLTNDVVDRRTTVGGFVEHAVEEDDEVVREAREFDVGEVVGTELVPRGPIVGEDDVGGGFEDDKAEAAINSCVSGGRKNEARRNTPEDVGLLAVPPSQNLRRNVLAIPLALEVLGKVAVTLRAHPSFASFRPPNRLSRARLPPGTRHRRSSHNTERVRPRPARRQSEIANLEVPTVGDEDIGGLEVEVNDVPRVKVGDASGDFGQDLPDARLVEDFVQAAVLFEKVGEVPVLAELGLDEEVARLLPGVYEGDEVGRAVDVGREEAEDVDFLESTKPAL